MSFRRAAGPEEPASLPGATTAAGRTALELLQMINDPSATPRSVQYNFHMPKHPASGHATKTYPQTKNFCFVCGQDNPHGMRLKFTQEGKRFVCKFRLSKRYTGPPGHCHGGIIATVLDDAMSKLNKLRQVIAVTSKMTVEYLKPVPLHKPLRVESHELSKRGRRLTHTAEISDATGKILARSKGVFIIIDPDRIFASKR